MSKMFVQDTTLTDIADAIREKTGITNTLFPKNMPSYIRSIQTTSSDTAGIPDDIIAEAERVANGMISKIGSNSLTFIAMSDTHEMGDNDHTSVATIEQYRRANLNAGQAAKIIANKVPLDFFAHLGDFAWGSSTTSIEDGVTAIRRVREYIADVSLNNESFFTPGNHDLMTYSYDVTNEYLSDGIAKGLIGDYRYLDFDAKKVRIICLNTSDLSGVTVTATRSAERISGEQLQWFCETLDLSAKSDASKWGIVILSHHPLDWCYIKPAGNVVAAYLNGDSYSTTHEGVAVSYDFSGKNSAKIIAQFHGHVHGFRVDYINDLRTNTAVPTTAKRVAIPNACFIRNNEYGRNETTEYNGIEFGEETTYDKVDNSTGKNTSFCLVSIDLDKEVIYADCFGAGYDRVISYAVEEIVTYNITNNLTNTVNSNSTNVVAAGSNYSASIIADDGYTLANITVTMGGTNITDSVVSGSNIAISSVTGDIVITATATKISPYTISYDLANVTSNNSITEAMPSTAYTATLTATEGCSINFARVIMGGTDITDAAYNNGNISIESVTGDIDIIAGYYTNLVPVSVSSDGSVYNGVGYKDGAYVSSGGSYGSDNTSGCTATGFIPYKSGDVIYIKGGILSANGRARLYIQESLSSGSAVALFSEEGYTDTTWGVNTTNGYCIFQIDKLGDKYYKLTPNSVLNTAIDEDDVYRLSLYGTGEKLVVTHNEPIESGGNVPEATVFSVTNNLTNVITSNAVSSVTEGNSYSATLTANDGYEISSVVVTMGGSDVTSSVYSDGNISISSVTGDIVITATANEIEIPSASYTNLVPTMTTVDGTAVFEGVGYKNKSYISSTGTGTDAECVATGLMPYDYKGGVRTPIYIKGCTINTSKSHCRIYGFNDLGQASFQQAYGSALTTYFNIETLGTNYYKVTPLDTIPANSYVNRFRFSLIGTGENLIITNNEPIE